jgi:hypothetical protein
MHCGVLMDPHRQCCYLYPHAACPSNIESVTLKRADLCFDSCNNLAVVSVLGSSWTLSCVLVRVSFSPACMQYSVQFLSCFHLFMLCRPRSILHKEKCVWILSKINAKLYFMLVLFLIIISLLSVSFVFVLHFNVFISFFSLGYRWTSSMH